MKMKSNKKSRKKLSANKIMVVKKLLKKNTTDTVATDDKLPLIVNKIRKITSSVKLEIYQIGKLLVEAKDIIKHGDFQKWIEDHFEFSHQAAVNFMNVYRCCLGRPDVVKTIKTSLLYQITAPGFPKDLREHIFKKKNQLNNIKNKKMHDIYLRFKNKELDLESPEVQQLFKKNKNKIVNKTYNKKVAIQIGKIKKLRDTVLSKTAKFQWPVHPETNEVEVEDDQLEQAGKLIGEIVTSVNNLIRRF